MADKCFSGCCRPYITGKPVTMPRRPGTNGGTFSVYGETRQFPPGALRFIASPLEVHIKHANSVLEQHASLDEVKSAEHN